MSLRFFLQAFSGFLRREHWWAESWSAFVCIGWGLQNFFDGRDLVYVAAYRLIVGIVPEQALEISSFALGIFQGVSLVLDKPKWRLTAATGACMFYSLLVLSFMAANPAPPGLVLGAGWIGVNMFAVARLARGIG